MIASANKSFLAQVDIRHQVAQSMHLPSVLVPALLPRSKNRGQGAMFGALFEGMGYTKVRSPALSQNFTNKGLLKFGSHMLLRSQSSKTT